MDNLPQTLPRCAQHGEMMLRPVARQTRDSQFCGTWYDCQRCGSSVLFESPELQAQLAEQRAALATEAAKKPTKAGKKCVNCEGTGNELLLCTMFVQDGYRRERCGICSGSGINPPNYRAWPGHLKFLKKANARILKWGGLKPPSAERAA